MQEFMKKNKYNLNPNMNFYQNNNIYQNNKQQTNPNYLIIIFHLIKTIIIIITWHKIKIII